MEFWRVIESFPDYEVNPRGEIKRTNRRQGQPEIKGTRLNHGGDLIIDLNRDDKRHTRKVSLLVAQAFLGEPESDAFNSVIHKDGDKTNCHVSNLVWRPRWFVVEYNRMFLTKPYNVSVEIVETGEVFGTLRDLCVKYGIIEKDAYSCLLYGSPTMPHEFRLKNLSAY